MSRQLWGTQDGRVYFELLPLVLELLFGGEGFEDVFLEVLNAVEEGSEGGLVVVEEGGEEGVAGLAAEQPEPVPELLSLLAPEEPELPALDLPDDLLVPVLQLPETILLADGLPGLLEQGDELVFDLGDAVDEVPLPRHSLVEKSCVIATPTNGQKFTLHPAASNALGSIYTVTPLPNC